MVNPDRKYMSRSQAAQAEIDVGLRDYMLRVYNYMALGVAVTGIVAMLVALNQPVLEAIALSPLKWVLFVVVLGLGWFAPRVIMSGSTAKAQVCFWAYSIAWGALISPMIAYYMAMDPMIVAQAFFITTAAFAGVSLYGYTTKRDLSPFATFFMMAAIGLLIAILINAFFVQSTMFSLLTSGIVVLLFSGITAYETQMIKSMYYEGDVAEVALRKAIFGAFILYGSFITLFIHILNILGIMRSE